MRYIVIFRTHFWDDGVAEMARRAQACCSGGYFVVATDNTNGPLVTDPYINIPFTDDFSTFSLPNIPENRVLWWNGDYVFYLIRDKMPAFDYYMMIDYDVLLNCNVDNIIAACSNRQIDLCSTHMFSHAPPQDADLDWPKPWMWTFFPCVILSGRAIDFMRSKRVELAKQLRDKKITHWPLCEFFTPTVLAQNSNMKIIDIAEFVDKSYITHRPYISLRDKRLIRENLIAHPVLVGRRFIQAILIHDPDGTPFASDGSLRSELCDEDLSELKAALNEHDYNLIVKGLSSLG